MESLLLEKHQAAAIITLNRPEAFNALSLDMVRALYTNLCDLAEDSSIRMVILRSLHPKAFCAGGDVRWLYDVVKRAPEDAMVFFREEYRLNAYMAGYPKPLFALLNGITMGGGAGISMHVAYPIATERTVFAMPETAIGLFPDVGLSYCLSRLEKPGLGMYLALTGKRIGGAELYAAGMAKAMVALEYLPAFTQALLAISQDTALPQAIDDVLERFMQTVEPHWPAPEILKAFTKPSVEAIFQALAVIDTEEAQALLAHLKSCSPHSLKLSFAQLTRAKSLTLDACLQQDETIVRHCIRHPDFLEGVRALLIDKDKSPIWQPDSLDNIEDTAIAAYFG